MIFERQRDVRECLGAGRLFGERGRTTSASLVSDFYGLYKPEASRDSYDSL